MPGDMYSGDKRFQSKSMVSDNCTSLRSSYMPEMSVASELEYNKENASLESIEMTDVAVTLHSGKAGPMANQSAHLGGVQANKTTTTGNLKKHVDRLLDKHVKMMDQMTMEDVGFQ